MNKYLVAVGEARPAAGDTPSASPAYRHVSAKDAMPAVEASTLFELFERSATKYATNACLGTRKVDDKGAVGPFVFMNYAEVAAKVKDVASGLAAVGGAPGAKVGVFGPNCPEWMIAMQACNRLNTVCVPLYDSLGENAIEYIINHAEAAVTFVATAKLGALAKALDKTKDTLKTIVYWGKGDEAAIKTAKDMGYTVHSFEELSKMGADKPAEAVPPKPDDLCTIMYTSGTTGDPKGVMLKHSAVLGGMAAAYFYAKENGIDFNEKDVFLSYLPLAHIFDRINEELFLYLGASIGYWQGDVFKLLDDIGSLKPTFFVGVPRVFDRIYAKVMGGVKTAPFVKRTLFNWGYSRKLNFLRAGRPQAHAAPFFDRLVFSKVKAALGGRVKALVSGGAPLSPHVEDFLRVAMCCPVVQGYGLTETCAASCIAITDDIHQAATVGPPTPTTELRLESVPDMKCDALDKDEPRGEVLLRGTGLFSGYYKAQDKTDEVMDAEGWFHTGDIGTITKAGALKIVDRKKNIFKLSQGEYIAVEKVEAVYKKNLLVEQVWVYGNSFESCLVGVVVPVTATMTEWAKANGVSGDFAAVCADPKAKAYVLAELTATAKEEKLKGFEQMKDIVLEAEPFSVEDELMTPTFKLKRPQLQAKYQKRVDAMYEALRAKESSKC